MLMRGHDGRLFQMQEVLEGVAELEGIEERTFRGLSEFAYTGDYSVPATSTDSRVPHWSDELLSLYAACLLDDVRLRPEFERLLCRVSDFRRGVCEKLETGDGENMPKLPFDGTLFSSDGWRLRMDADQCIFGT
ncbi:hypothetical protein AAE478_002713 [Parahypoxylon ruwenzoriense]